MTKIVAVVCTRNESLHIENCLSNLINEGISVCLIDNESTDDTLLKAKKFIGNGLLQIECLPWKGFFSLSDQLEVKARIIEKLDFDWVLHVDADEVLTSCFAEQTLSESLFLADKQGYNCVNFNEFVFVPLYGEDYTQSDFYKKMLNYYYFSPYFPRLMRAWKKSTNLVNINTGGHKLTGDNLKLSPVNHILRHYIVLSEEHAQRKYCERKFSDEDLSKGWHGNRIIISEDNIRLRLTYDNLKRLPHWDSKKFDISCPVAKHYWELS